MRHPAKSPSLSSDAAVRFGGGRNGIFNANIDFPPVDDHDGSAASSFEGRGLGTTDTASHILPGSAELRDDDRAQKRETSAKRGAKEAGFLRWVDDEAKEDVVGDKRVKQKEWLRVRDNNDTSDVDYDGANEGMRYVMAANWDEERGINTKSTSFLS
jgi:hypothetical protein